MSHLNLLAPGGGPRSPPEGALSASPPPVSSASPREWVYEQQIGSWKTPGWAPGKEKHRERGRQTTGGPRHGAGCPNATPQEGISGGGSSQRKYPSGDQSGSIPGGHRADGSLP